MSAHTIGVVLVMVITFTCYAGTLDVRSMSTTDLQKRRAEIERKIADDDFGVAWGLSRWISHAHEKEKVLKEKQAIDAELARRGRTNRTSEVPPSESTDAARLTVVDYFLRLPEVFEGTPAQWLTFLKQPKCGVIDVPNGYMRCIGDGAQAPFEVALFRFRDGSPLLAVAEGDYGEVGKEDARSGLVFLKFFRTSTETTKLHEIDRSIFPIPDASERKGDWRFELPQYGKTVLVFNQETGAVLHTITWNGDKFVEVK